MPRAISEDLRRRVVAAYKAGNATYEDVAARFGVSRATVDRLLARHRRTGSVAASPHGGAPPRRLDAHGDALLRTLVEGKPDRTNAELAAALEALGHKVSTATVSRRLKAMSLTRKKRR